MLYKSINFTEISYNVLDAPRGAAPDVTVKYFTEKRATVAKKMSNRMVRAFLRKLEGDALIQQTITYRVYHALYRMPMQRFLTEAERVPSGRNVDETDALA